MRCKDCGGKRQRADLDGDRRCAGCAEHASRAAEQVRFGQFVLDRIGPLFHEMAPELRAKVLRALTMPPAVKKRRAA